EDVAKELAIYRAHKAAPVVVASEGESFPAALATVTVPAVPPELAFVLSAMAGHLFGYEAALAIDGQARPLREARAAIEAAASTEVDAEATLERLRAELQPLAARFLEDLRAGSYDGSLEASTASRVAALRAGAGRDRLSYRALRTLAALDPAVAEVTGYARYRIEGSPTEGQATVSVLDKGGVVANVASRAERDPRLRGTKRQVARNQEVTVARGRSDGRTFILVPETKDNQTTELTLLHVRFHDRLAPSVVAGVLQGYRGRYAILRDAVTETEPVFREDLLGEIPVVDLLEQPLHVLADRWRSQP